MQNLRVKCHVHYEKPQTWHLMYLTFCSVLKSYKDTNYTNHLAVTLVAFVRIRKQLKMIVSCYRCYRCCSCCTCYSCYGYYSCYSYCNCCKCYIFMSSHARHFQLRLFPIPSFVCRSRDVWWNEQTLCVSSSCYTQLCK